MYLVVAEYCVAVPRRRNVDETSVTVTRSETWVGQLDDWEGS